MKRILTYTVTPQYNGMRIDTLLRTHYHMSGSLIKELKRTDDGLILNGKRALSTDLITENDIVQITMYDTVSKNIEPIKLPFKVIYEDEDIIIVSKPAGMPTHISQGNYNNTLANAMMYYFKEKGEEHVFRAVNRLDKDTSGLMCIAKNKYSHARLCDDLTKKHIKRRYRAIICGRLTENGTIDAPIGRCTDSVIKRTVVKNGARAVTHYHIVQTYSEFTLIELSLETGRTHQIRVHMAYIGTPLLGDWLYGTENKELFLRHALHSCYLALTHPVTGKFLEFYEDIPSDMKNFLENTKK